MEGLKNVYCEFFDSLVVDVAGCSRCLFGKCEKGLEKMKGQRRLDFVLRGLGEVSSWNGRLRWEEMEIAV